MFFLEMEGNDEDTSVRNIDTDKLSEVSALLCSKRERVERGRGKIHGMPIVLEDVTLNVHIWLYASELLPVSLLVC